MCVFFAYYFSYYFAYSAYLFCILCISICIIFIFCILLKNWIIFLHIVLHISNAYFTSLFAHEYIYVDYLHIVRIQHSAYSDYSAYSAYPAIGHILHSLQPIGTVELQGLGSFNCIYLPTWRHNDVLRNSHHTCRTCTTYRKVLNLCHGQVTAAQIDFPISHLRFI
jgi:hypothetical protein